MGVIVEHFADEKGIVWPENIAPFTVYLARLGEDSKVVAAADKLYKELSTAGIEVLYDDRDERAGAKFADADLLGIPYRVVISEKTLQADGCELKHRTKTETENISPEKLIKQLVD